MAAGQIGPDVLIVLGCLFIGVVFSVVFITLAQRRIPTQSAKHVRGRKVYGGTKQYLPLKINQAGVMPIIFASSLLMIPGVLFGLMVPMFSGDSGFSDFMSRMLLSLSTMFQSSSSFV
ncbi:MAG: preprotein translocase subunit SecY, partial [Pirellulaceae bacterium]